MCRSSKTRTHRMPPACTSATSAPGLGSPRHLPHLPQHWARPAHICTGTGLTPPTSASGLARIWVARHQAAAWRHHAHASPVCGMLCRCFVARTRGCVHAPAARGCVTRIGAWPDRQAAAPTLDRPAHAQQSRPDSCAALPSGPTRPRPSQARPAVARQALGHLASKQPNKQTTKQTNKQTGPRAAARVRSDPSQTCRPHVRTRCGGLPWACRIHVLHPVLHPVPQRTTASGISTVLERWRPT
jgi:hypothetical protein